MLRRGVENKVVLEKLSSSVLFKNVEIITSNKVFTIKTYTLSCSATFVWFVGLLDVQLDVPFKARQWCSFSYGNVWAFHSQYFDFFYT